MSRLGIQKAEESGNYVVTFSQEQFSEFFTSLTSSPREETIRKTTGFDANKDKIQHLLERIEYQVGTQSNLAKSDYNFSCTLADKHEYYWSSKASFFGTHEIFQSHVESFTVTMTFMVGFNREGSNNVERQVISIEFNTVPTGYIKIKILSTEITWPPSIFQLIEREIAAFTIDQEKEFDRDIRFFSPIIKAMITDRLSSNIYNLIERFGKETRWWSRFRDRSFAVMSGVQVILLVFLLRFSSQRPLLNPETGLFERGSFEHLVETMGFDAAVEQARISQIAYSQGYGEWAAGEGPLSFILASINGAVMSWGVVLGIGICLVFVYCRRRTETHILRLSGRIYLDRNPIPPRENISKSTGLFEGIATGLFATAIWVGATELFKLLS